MKITLEIDASVYGLYETLSTRTHTPIEEILDSALVIYPIIRALPGDEQTFILDAVRRVSGVF